MGGTYMDEGTGSSVDTSESTSVDTSDAINDVTNATGDVGSLVDNNDVAGENIDEIEEDE